MQVQPSVEILLVGGGSGHSDPRAAELSVAWLPETEAETLSRIAVGLYPVDRSHPLADGKAGFKAILYMAQGIPPVVTPTPTNSIIVREGVDGIYAENRGDWMRAIERLLGDNDLWEAMSLSAFERARLSYSLEVWAPRIVGRLLGLMTG